MKKEIAKTTGPLFKFLARQINLLFETEPAFLRFITSYYILYVMLFLLRTHKTCASVIKAR